MVYSNSKKIILFKSHALSQINERGISQEIVRDIIRYPGQISDSFKNRKVAQDILKIRNKYFLVRVVFEEYKDNIEIVTVYLTNKIMKYWEGNNENQL